MSLSCLWSNISKLVLEYYNIFIWIVRSYLIEVNLHPHSYHSLLHPIPRDHRSSLSSFWSGYPREAHHDMLDSFHQLEELQPQHVMCAVPRQWSNQINIECGSMQNMMDTDKIMILKMTRHCDRYCRIYSHLSQPELLLTSFSYLKLSYFWLDQRLWVCEVEAGPMRD